MGLHPGLSPRLGSRVAAAKLLPAGSVLLSSRAPIGLTAINNAPMATNQGFKSLIPDSKRVDSRFLLRWLRYNRPRIEALGNGATFKEISKKVTSAIPIELPPIEEQRRIAAVLDAADDLRTKRRQALAKLDSLTQAIFIDMFGDLYLNERAWPTVSVQDVCELVVDCVNKTAPVVDGPTPFKMLRTTNVKHGAVDVENVKYVDEPTYVRWTRTVVPQPNDVLLTREAPVGETGILRSSDHVFLGQRLMLYRCDESRIVPEFLQHSFHSTYLQRQFEAGGSGSTVKHLKLPVCRGLKLRVPPIDQQRQFAERVSACDTASDSFNASIESLDTLFASLQQRAFAGEL